MNNSVLIFGKNSFVASGIEEVLTNSGFEIEFFTRGESNRKGNIIFGKTEDILQNPFFQQEYDFIINYVVLKNSSISENLDFIKSLLEFGLKHNVKKLIHFSSIMVYNYDEKYIDENTKIESSIKTTKKGYGAIKIAVDEFILSVKSKYPFEIILVRPGYVLDKSRVCPFVKKFPFRINLIKGNKKSKQPIVKKEKIHKAIKEILTQNENLSVYHFFPNNDQTKFQFAKENYNGIFLPMPEIIFRYIPLLINKLGILPKSLYSRFEGMYIKGIFSSKQTEKKLKIKF